MDEQPEIAEKSLLESLEELMAAEQSGQGLPNVAPPPDQRQPRPSDFAWVRTLRDEHEASFQADFWTRLYVMPAGPRIRHLRRVLGWTQERMAGELQISLRTVIRHEQDKQHRPWRHSAWRWRLSELERNHGNQLLTYYMGS